MIREAPVAAVPAERPEESVAYRIVRGAFPELQKKELLPVPMPMTKDPKRLRKATGPGRRRWSGCWIPDGTWPF